MGRHLKPAPESRERVIGLHRDDILSYVMTASELIASARRRHSVSQRSLARRAGTTQAYVSAIERGRAQPTVEMLRRLLLVMGEDLVLDSKPTSSDADHDPMAFAHERQRSPEERLREGLAWMALTVE
jgi:transcriptional regulator with XRE-family HTH domain